VALIQHKCESLRFENVVFSSLYFSLEDSEIIVLKSIHVFEQNFGVAFVLLGDGTFVQNKFDSLLLFRGVKSSAGI
jgi:hypothetical protein